MSYTAMYRKFRPRTFSEVKGQEHIVTTLQNQILSDRIQHAYLFCGTRGTGKTTIAKIFAKAINCEHKNGADPCLECDTCKAIAQGSSMNVIEIDAASNNGVDNIRTIIDEVSYAPTEGKYKVYIIDEVHMLSAGAFNALLKTLEEPPAYVVFILATTEVHKLPITILSRCQRYDFKRISVEHITERIHEVIDSEGIEAEDAAVRYIARSADGALRDALSLLDQAVAFNFGKKLTLDLVLDTLGAVDTEVFSRLLREIICANVGAAIKILEEIIMDGRELVQFTSDFTWYIRNLLLVITSDDVSGVVDMSKENIEKLKHEAIGVSMDGAMRYIRILSELTNQLRYASNKRVLTELAIIKMCMPQTEVRDDTFLERIRAIESQLENGVLVKNSNQYEYETLEAVEAGEKESTPLPKAVPDDIKKVAQNWQRVIEGSVQPIKSYLAKATPSLGENGELVIVLRTVNDKRYFFEGEAAEEHMSLLQKSINKVADSEVSIRLEALNNTVKSEKEYFDISKMFPQADIIVEEEE